MSGQTDPNPVTRFFGGLMMAAGILIAATAGLCSLGLTVFALVDTAKTSSGNVGELITLGLPMVLLFGGIPLGVGLALFFIGRRLFRERPANPAQGAP